MKSGTTKKKRVSKSKRVLTRDEFIKRSRITRFYEERCTKGGLGLIRDNFVSASCEGKTSTPEVIRIIVARAGRPIPIEFVSSEIDGPVSSRETMFFNYAEAVIDEFVLNYPNLFWWVTDKGLNVDHILPDQIPSKLSPFDAFAGKLMEEHRVGNRVPKESLLLIARSLDEQRFTLKDHLQPGHWKMVAKHNQNSPKRPIQSFEDVARHPSFVRGVRKRLYVARNNWIADQIGFSRH